MTRAEGVCDLAFRVWMKIKPHHPFAIRTGSHAANIGRDGYTPIRSDAVHEIPRITHAACEKDHFGHTGLSK